MFYREADAEPAGRSGTRAGGAESAGDLQTPLATRARPDAKAPPSSSTLPPLPPSSPSAARRGSPSPAARAGWLLAPRRGREGSEGPQGREVNSPQCQQSRPRPRLPGAEVPPCLRASDYTQLLDYTSQNAQGEAPQVSRTCWTTFPRMQLTGPCFPPAGSCFGRRWVQFESFLWRCNCQISFCFIHFLKLMRK